jgi:hypothetical protein
MDPVRPDLPTLVIDRGTGQKEPEALLVMVFAFNKKTIQSKRTKFNPTGT